VQPLLLPTILLVLAGALHAVAHFGLLPSTPSLRTPLEALVWLAGAFFLGRVAAALTRAAFQRRSGRPPPALLVDIVVILTVAAALSTMAVVVFGISPTAAFTTSGMVIAVVAFAVRSLVADLFYGLTMAIERPFEIGDWIALNDGVVGRVEEMTWRAVKLVTKENVRIVVPNTLLAAEHLVNYDQPLPHWRKSLTLVLDYDVAPGQVDTLLATAVGQVSESLRVGAPDARIVGYSERGVEWELRYWLPDYATATTVEQQIQEALLRNLRLAGIRVPRPREELFVGSIERERQTDASAGRDWTEHVELLTVLTVEERADLRRRARTHRVAPGTPVVRQGQPGASLFVVQEGLLGVCIETTSGAEEAVGSLGPGAVFGELSLLTGAPRSATVAADTVAVVHELTKDAIEPLLQAHPELAERFAEIVTDRRLADARRARTREARDVAERAGMVNQLVARARAFFGLGEPPARRAAG
jgi:small-conductance mechanosensitive channel/CRP-like cAMP-binding protein